MPGGVYHVILRGNGRQDIFFEREDRHHFYLLLQAGVTRYAHWIHGVCLMTNHVHLAVQVGEVPLSKIVQNLAFRYTRWVIRRQRRVGHLFQGRYKAVLVEAHRRPNGHRENTHPPEQTNRLRETHSVARQPGTPSSQPV